MSDTFKRRRKRTGATSARLQAVQVAATEQGKSATLGSAEIGAFLAVSVVCLALCALIWILALRAEQEERAQITDRAEHSLAGQAATLAETIGHELLLIDQSLSVLQAAWKENSDSVDLDKLKQTMPALTAVADDLFIADDKHIIRQDILPQAIGQGVGSAYVTFPHGTLESFRPDGTKDKESLVLQAPGGAPVDAREFLTYIVRPLDHPSGWLIGASYRSAEVTKLFSAASLGFDSVVALVDSKRGSLQAVVGPAARRPKTDLSQSPLFSLLSRSPDGTWTGETPVDGIVRLHAFHRVAKRDMVVVVGTPMSEVLAPAAAVSAGIRATAAVATALVLLIGALVLWELYTLRGHRRRLRILERNRMELDRLRAEDVTTSARARINAARLQAILDNTGDGIALLDSSLRLVQWNQAFQYGIGTEPRPEMSLDMLLADQVHAGMFGPVANVEAEIARRSGILRAGDPEGLSQRGPGGEKMVLRGLPVSEGGYILLLSGLANLQVPAAPPAPAEVNVPPSESTAPAPIEW